MARSELSRGNVPPISSPDEASRGRTVNHNNVRAVREALMMSKAELARRANLSTLTIDRVEAGKSCRLDTMRKILQALGLKVSDKDRVFGALGIEVSETPNRTRDVSDRGY